MAEQGELADVVSKLLEISKEISDAKEDLKVLIQAEKKMKERLKENMIQKDIDTINLKKGKIKLKKTIKRGGFSKKTVTDGLTKFFSGDEAQLEGALNSIRDMTPEKETVSLSMTGIKERRE